jgi:hypothetical protein
MENTAGRGKRMEAGMWGASFEFHDGKSMDDGRWQLFTDYIHTDSPSVDRKKELDIAGTKTTSKIHSQEHGVCLYHYTTDTTDGQMDGRTDRRIN